MDDRLNSLCRNIYIYSFLEYTIIKVIGIQKLMEKNQEQLLSSKNYIVQTEIYTVQRPLSILLLGKNSRMV